MRWRLPAEPGTVLQYFNARDERIIAVLCDTGLWRVTAATGRGAVHQLSWTPAALAADLWRVTYYDVVPEP